VSLLLALGLSLSSAVPPIQSEAADQESSVLTREQLESLSLEGVDWSEESDFEWILVHQGIEPLQDGRDDLQVIRSPRLISADREVRASVAIAWTKSDGTLSLGGETPATDLAVRVPPPPERLPDDGPSVPNFLDDFLDEPLLEQFREIYLEGPVEYFVDGERLATAEALYVDAVEGRGWVSEARYTVRERIGSSNATIKVEAEWLRISADGSLRSNRARVTTSKFAVPSYYIQTSDLRMQPTGDPQSPYRVQMKGNVINLRGWLNLPLPPLDYLANEEGEPTFGGLRVGNEARFGTVVGVELNRDVREGFGDRINRVLGGDPNDFRSRFRADVSYLGSRGALFDLGLRLNSGRPEQKGYNWNLDLALVPDSDEDRGFIEVPKEERDGLRRWFRSRGRFRLDDERDGGREWIEVTLTQQSDPGLQSEFFEQDFLRYEERQSYIQWRNANDALFTSTSVVVNLDDFRREIEQLPGFRLVRQRLPVSDLWGAQVLYDTDLRVGYDRREDGTEPYEPLFADGLGERELFRADNSHRLEVPIDLGWGGMILTPFSALELSGWSEGATEDQALGRVSGAVGSRLATSLWRRGSNGSLAELSPSIRWRNYVLTEDPDEELVIFDQLEAPREGSEVEVGLRGRYQLADPQRLTLDGEVRGVYRSQREGIEDAWDEIGVFASLGTSLFDVPVQLAHDGRYDPETGNTDYSRTGFLIYPDEDLDLSVAFSSGRNQADERLFEAATLGALYRFTPKWDLQGRHTVDLQEGNALDTSLTIRRFGHDIQFELILRDRSGEGFSVGIRVRPLLTERKQTRRLGIFGR
jgi:hypothetical protein